MQLNEKKPSGRNLFRTEKVELVAKGWKIKQIERQTDAVEEALFKNGPMPNFLFKNFSRIFN